MGTGSFLTEGDLIEAQRCVGDEPPAPVRKRHVSEGKGRGLQTPESRESRRKTMLERYGSESICRSNPYLTATMHLSGWFPDPDVPAEHGVKMRILRGV